MNGTLKLLLVPAFLVAGCATVPKASTQPAAQKHMAPKASTQPAAQKRLAPNEADVYIAGMACPFCAYSVEKKFREIATVRSVSTDMNTGIAHVVFEKGATPDPKALWGKTKKSGFTPTKIVTAGGDYRGQ